jgi:UDPglucose 6-dehydrogenase
MKVTIVGSGYAGLVTCACFSPLGIHDTCVNIDQKKIENLNKGIIPIYEPCLENMIVSNMKKERISFTTNIAKLLADSKFLFIYVSTPTDDDSIADLKDVIAVAKHCGKHMNNYMLVVTKNTVSAETTKKVKKAAQEELENRNVNIKFDIGSNPEFLKENATIIDFLKPDRIVVGLDSQKAKNLMKSLYKPFTLNDHPIIFINIISAEVTKYATNAMLALNISFINDIAKLCEIVGTNVHKAIKGIGSDSRIGPKFMYPGIGYGGSCFPKDFKVHTKTAGEHHCGIDVLKAVEAVNQYQKLVLFNKINTYFRGNLKGEKIGICDLCFKPQTDDMGAASLLYNKDSLLQAGAIVKAYDPLAIKEAKHYFDDTITYRNDQYKALIDSDCLLGDANRMARI